MTDVTVDAMKDSRFRKIETFLAVWKWRCNKLTDQILVFLLSPVALRHRNIWRCYNPTDPSSRVFIVFPVALRHSENDTTINWLTKF
jgi:hypothetical protein